MVLAFLPGETTDVAAGELERFYQSVSLFGADVCVVGHDDGQQVGGHDLCWLKPGDRDSVPLQSGVNGLWNTETGCGHELAVSQLTWMCEEPRP